MKPAQSLEGKPMVTSVSMVQGPMTARYVFGHEDQELGQVLYTHLAAFYSDTSRLLESGSTCSPANMCRDADASPTRFTFVLP